jgi:hypothetical protein
MVCYIERGLQIGATFDPQPLFIDFLAWLALHHYLNSEFHQLLCRTISICIKLYLSLFLIPP